MDDHYSRNEIKEEYSEKSDHRKTSQEYVKTPVIHEALMTSALERFAFEMKTVFIPNEDGKTKTMHHYHNPNRN